MKALTLIQPWASLLANGHKRFETRSWAVGYRGPLYIHAGVKPIPVLPEDLEADCRRFFGRDWRQALPKGAVIGRATLAEVFATDLVQVRDYLLRHPTELRRGDFTPGRFAWDMTEPEALPLMPWRGALGLWDFTPPPGGLPFGEVA